MARLWMNWKPWCKPRRSRIDRAHGKTKQWEVGGELVFLMTRTNQICDRGSLA